MTTTYRIRYPGGHYKLNASSREVALAAFRTCWPLSVRHYATSKPVKVHLDEIVVTTIASEERAHD